MRKLRTLLDASPSLSKGSFLPILRKAVDCFGKEFERNRAQIPPALDLYDTLLLGRSYPAPGRIGFQFMTTCAFQVVFDDWKGNDARDDSPVYFGARVFRLGEALEVTARRLARYGLSTSHCSVLSPLTSKSFPWRGIERTIDESESFWVERLFRKGDMRRAECVESFQAFQRGLPNKLSRDLWGKDNDYAVGFYLFLEHLCGYLRHLVSSHVSQTAKVFIRVGVDRSDWVRGGAEKRVKAQRNTLMFQGATAAEDMEIWVGMRGDPKEPADLMAPLYGLVDLEIWTGVHKQLGQLMTFGGVTSTVDKLAAISSRGNWDDGFIPLAFESFQGLPERVRRFIAKKYQWAGSNRALLGFSANNPPPLHPSLITRMLKPLSEIELQLVRETGVV